MMQSILKAGCVKVTKRCFLSSWYILEFCRLFRRGWFVKESGAVNRWEHFTMEMIFAGWEMYNWFKHVCERD